MHSTLLPCSLPHTAVFVWVYVKDLATLSDSLEESGLYSTNAFWGYLGYLYVDIYIANKDLTHTVEGLPSCCNKITIVNQTENNFLTLFFLLFSMHKVTFHPLCKLKLAPLGPPLISLITPVHH